MPGNVTSYSPDAATTGWLRHRMIKEAAFRMTEACVLGVAGLITTAILAVITSVGMLLILAAFGNPVQHSSYTFFFCGVFLVILLFSLFLHRSDPDQPDYLGIRTQSGWPELVEALVGANMLARDLFSGGGRLFMLGYESASTASRLLRADTSEVAAIIIWLWHKKAKARTGEICRRFPGLNTVQILPQLRFIPGVIWLPDPRGIFLLSEDFRRELGRYLVEEPAIGASAATDEPPPETDNEKPVDQRILDWYKTLELAPYVSIKRVKRKYHELAKRYHPDIIGVNDPDAGEMMKRINAAYEGIMDLHRRRADG
jgi:hypothetical protein